MKIAVTGSVGSGKTTIAKKLSEELSIELLDLSELAKKYELRKDTSLQTFDFDLNKLLLDLEKKLQNCSSFLILEGHFSHFIDPKYVDLLVVLSRDLIDLKKEYISRGYNNLKIADNLEAEAFNVCFYEAEENGYDSHQILYLENKDIDKTVQKIKARIQKLN